MIIKIDEIKKLGLKITWKLLYLGFSKNNVFKQFSLDLDNDLDEIVKYAIEKLELGEENDLLYEITSLYKYETSLAFDILYKLAEEENSDYEIEIRKIRLAIIYKNTKIKNDNFIDGLMDLQDLLLELEYGLEDRLDLQHLLPELEDIPIIIQCRSNIYPTEYYKQETYDTMYKNIMIWQENELSFLKSIQ